MLCVLTWSPDYFVSSSTLILDLADIVTASMAERRSSVEMCLESSYHVKEMHSSCQKYGHLLEITGLRKRLLCTKNWWRSQWGKLCETRCRWWGEKWQSKSRCSREAAGGRPQLFQQLLHNVRFTGEENNDAAAKKNDFQSETAHFESTNATQKQVRSRFDVAGLRPQGFSPGKSGPCPSASSHPLAANHFSAPLC